MSTCLYANMYVSTSRAYMLPTSADYVLCLKSCIMSSQSFATVLVVPPVCLTTSISNNVIKKPITCHCSVMKLPCKCLRKSTILKDRNAMNYVSEPVKRVVNCSRSTSTSSSGFVCQPVRFNKSVHKHVSSWVVNKPILSVNPRETFRTIVKCRNKFYDVWVQFLILFSLVSLNYGYLSFNIDCYYLKANTIVNNLTVCLIFVKYHIYNFSDCLSKICFRVFIFLLKLIPVFPD